MFKFQKPKLFIRFEFDIWCIRIYFEFRLPAEQVLWQAGISCFEFKSPCKRNYLKGIVYINV
jgi:hypothetical protein